jgi:hypothetical protein
VAANEGKGGCVGILGKHQVPEQFGVGFAIILAGLRAVWVDYAYQSPRRIRTGRGDVVPRPFTGIAILRRHQVPEQLGVGFAIILPA